MRSLVTVLALSGVVAISSCDASRTLGPDDGYLKAQVTGAIEEQYQGTGTFTIGTQSDGSSTFLMYSESDEEGLSRVLHIRQIRGGRLAKGTYDVTLQGPSAVEGLRVQYWRARDTQTLFLAEEGQITIADSRTDRVEGTLSVTAFSYCVRELPSDGGQTIEGPCSLPSEPIEDAPRILVTGSFLFTPESHVTFPSVP